MYSTVTLSTCLLFGIGVLIASRSNIIHHNRLQNVTCIGAMAALFFSSPVNATTHPPNHIPTATIPHEISEWQTYSDDDVNLHFLYPKDWEVKERDFYETAGGSVATKPTLVVGPIPSKSDREDTIWINMRQATCMTEEVIEEYQNMTLWGLMPRNGVEGCVEAEVHGYHLLSFFNNPDVVKVFKRMVMSLQAGGEK